MLGRRSKAWIVCGLVFGAAVAGAAPACIATGPDLSQITGHGGDGFGEKDAGTPTSTSSIPTTTDPHAVIGTQPSHGPFAGGQRVLVRGNGFSGQVKVWFGETEATDVVPVDATKVQVTAPPGDAGPIDVTAQNGDDASTKRTLTGAYAYDAIYADPSSGPVSGGSEVHIYGQGTSWDATTQAFIDQVACAALTVVSPTELLCLAPKGTPGAKTIRVTSGTETLDVLDGYTYEDSTNGFKGGLSGAALAGHLQVNVYDNYTGNPIPGAAVIVGSDISTALIKQADATGVVTFVDPSLTSAKTVTVAGTCVNPITFVDVPVDTVTVYLDPVLSPLCGASGDPPGTGTKVGAGGGVLGEIVFPQDMEFKPGSWKVPGPIGNERMVAYVFAAATSPNSPFQLPAASAAITPMSVGSIGYGFSFYVAPGDKTLYALAGLEDRSKPTPTFVAYAMGVVRGVPVFPNENTKDVFIKMNSLLDEALVVTPHPPGLGPKGPDRLAAGVALKLGTDGYAILPGAQKTPLLPFQGNLNFVGVPVLNGALYGSSYLLSTRAVTGQALGPPMSVVSSVQATTTAFPIDVDGFVGVPTLDAPALNTAWDGQHLTTHFAAGGAPIDLVVFDVASGNGLQHWKIAAPGIDTAVTLPDITAIPGAALGSGPLTIAVYGAQIDNFDYGALRYKHMSPGGMTSYSLDYFSAHLP